MVVKPVLSYVSIAHVRKVDCYTLGEQNWFSYEYDNDVLITLKDAAPLKPVSSDGTEE